MFFKRFDVVYIYGVTDMEAQNRILKQFAEYHHANRTRSIRVRFLEKENWTTWNYPGGASGGSRGPEKVIRLAVIL